MYIYTIIKTNDMKTYSILNEDKLEIRTFNGTEKEVKALVKEWNGDFREFTYEEIK